MGFSSIAAQHSAPIGWGFADPMCAANWNDYSGQSVGSLFTSGAAFGEADI